MRGKVRDADPPSDDGTLDELVAEAPAGDGPATDPPRSTHLLEHGRWPVAADLGPNGDVVLDLLARAAALTDGEARALQESAAWHWGQLTPFPAAASLPAARAIALIRGRADGRSEAIVSLEAAVASLTHAGPRRRGSLVAAAIASAGLAVLVRDLIDSEVFETLFGPWRAVMHH